MACYFKVPETPPKKEVVASPPPPPPPPPPSTVPQKVEKEELAPQKKPVETKGT